MLLQSKLEFLLSHDNSFSHTRNLSSLIFWSLDGVTNLQVVTAFLACFCFFILTQLSTPLLLVYNCSRNPTFYCKATTSGDFSSNTPSQMSQYEKIIETLTTLFPVWVCPHHFVAASRCDSAACVCNISSEVNNVSEKNVHISEFIAGYFRYHYWHLQAFDGMFFWLRWMQLEK